jgi:hypothetical protein
MRRRGRPGATFRIFVCKCECAGYCGGEKAGGGERDDEGEEGI